LELENCLLIRVGDSSGDGHEKTDSMFFSLTHSAAEVMDAYDKAVEDYGLDVCQECEDYEMYHFSRGFIESLIETFKDKDGLSSDMKRILAEAEAVIKSDGVLTAEIYSFYEIYLSMAKLIIPDLCWEQAGINEVDIGGYGLFN
jgi:hypothetical protein